MKTIKNLALGVLAALALAPMLHTQITQAAPFGSAFTYQGRLNFSGAPAINGLYDFRFELHSDATVVAPVGTPSTLTLAAVPVTNGLFTVPLDFGAPAFTSGEARWLQLQVATNGITPLTPLNPRQRLTPTPQAIYAGSATTAATASSVAPGTVTSAGLAPGSVNGTAIADGSIASADLNPTLLNNTFWKLTGNAGTAPSTHFLGTTDNQALELNVNGYRALRLEPNVGGAPNVIGGASNNFVMAGVVGATIGGGGAVNYLGFSYTNKVTENFGTVGGGWGNTSSGDDAATVGGGDRNTSSGQSATVGGGSQNISSGQYATVGGGLRNTSSGYAATVSGGGYNTSSNYFATVGGGDQNISSGYAATVGGGGYNTSSSNSATVGGGAYNTSSGFVATVGGGLQNTSSDSYATVGGGYQNTSSGNRATVGGGERNTSSGYAATVGGGVQNTSSNYFATVGGGYQNTSSDYATVGGGYQNTSSGYAATVGGGVQNTNSGLYATVGGGILNTSSDYAATVGGGQQNTSSRSWATVPGGYLNSAGGSFSFAAGRRAKADHTSAFVWADSTDADFASTAANQFLIRAAGGVGINTNNPNGAALAVNGMVAASSGASEPFEARGTVAGYSLYDRVSQAAGRWVMYAAGGTLGFYSASAGTTLMTVSPSGTVSATAFNPPSDRNLKENFTPVSARAVLDKVTALPISRWNFKGDAATPHVGPMAQDFHAAFSLGTDDKHIATVDADGVALAAIQGLNQKVEEEVTVLRAENAALKQRLEKLEQLMNRQDGGAR